LIPTFYLHEEAAKHLMKNKKNKSKTEPNWLDIVTSMCFCLFDLQKWFELTSSSLLCG
jgi:hypothetical protein